VRDVLPGTRAVNPPLGLATLAALCPPGWDVEIVDENVESVPLEPEADIVGVCGMGVQFPRQRELLAYYRGRGHYVVAGGSYASLCPEIYAPLADSVVAGEAEYIWKEFCGDFERGVPRALYRETGTVALTDSPVPRFDLLKLDRYSNATLQFSRGCPFRCEFCDIIVMFGRRPRTKGLAQVGRELDELRRAGARQVFFVDDNLIGDRRRAKELLRFLKRYQDEHDYRFGFGTEVSLNLASDPELLGLFRAANFVWVFIGIESSDPAVLRETGKTQNLKMDSLVAIRRIYAHGIDVLGGFIIGFDGDTLDAFDTQARFITDAGIQAAMVGLLTALPRTPLYERLQREGRLRPAAGADNTQAATNIQPRTMGYEAMIDGYRDLYRRLLSAGGIARRIRNKVRYLRSPVYRSGYSMAGRIGIVLRLLFKGILPGGLPMIFQFVRSLPFFSPDCFPLVIADWIAGLSMRRFAQQHLALGPLESAAITRRLAAVRSAIAGYVAEGKVTLRLGEGAVPHLAVVFDGRLDRRVFARLAPQLRRLMRQTRVRLVLYVDGLQAAQSEPFARLLGRLARYGDRVSIVANERLHALLALDSSVFNVVLASKAK
jgi:radical SAM superfamily enzyme YgiQ (UPF0313 family)